MQDSDQIFFMHRQTYPGTNFNKKRNRVTYNLAYKDDSFSF